MAGLMLAAMTTGGAMGGTRAPAPDCTPTGGEPVAVAAVGDDLTLTLADGRLVRLAGIDPPRAPPARPALVAEARRRLTDWLVGAPALLRPLSPADRWNRLPALVFAPATAAAPGAPLLVAQALVDAGFARGHPEPEAHACWPAILAAEGAARVAGLGLWSDPYYAVRNADDLPALDDAMGTIALVQGRIANVGQTRARLYLDLGPIHRAVALRLARRSAFILDQLGLSHDRLVGLTVRARGLMDDRNGPHIDVTNADQIEVLGAAGPAQAGAGGP